MSIDGIGSNYVNRSATQSVNSTQESLASGQRINGAADDAAGLQIANRLTSQIDGNGQAIANSTAGISVTQIAQAGLSSINDNLSSLRDIAVQAGNGAYSDSDRAALQQQANGLIESIRSTVADTSFAGQELLTEDGSLGFQVGEDSDSLFNVATNDLNGALTASGLFAFDVNDPTNLSTALNAVDESLANVATLQADYGATQNAFSSRVDSLLAAQVNESAGRSRIADADIASTVSSKVVNSILEQSSTAIQAQANADAGRSLSLLSS
ncbi:flagellin [Marinomonas ostreistagni]|uniref:flagellin n=1 Tax=Marinomonas ostreistagni TaxID=359209 RepID=UPI001950A5FC|nr:flagellin [Marinomonas ostreistagni]MBM6552389.1 flagellin FliC [Marinomonas ostreistagni]